MFRKIFILISFVVLFGVGCDRKLQTTTTLVQSKIPKQPIVASSPTPTPFLPLPVPAGQSYTEPEPEAVTNEVSKPYSPPTSAIIVPDDPNTWPRFTFKELGFSIKLPFDSKAVTSGYAECIKGHLFSNILMGRVCDNDNNYSYWFSGQVQGKKWPYNFLGSVSEYYQDGGEGSLTKLHDFTQKDGKYFIGPTRINPIDVIPADGIPVIVFDPNKDLYSGLDLSSMSAAIFKLPNNKNFKAVALQFYRDDLDFGRLIKAIQTIELLEPASFLSQRNDSPVPLNPSNYNVVSLYEEIATSSRLVVSAGINRNEPSTWPRFSFKELGFSVQLPFNKNAIITEYKECINGSAYGSDGLALSHAMCDGFGDHSSSFKAYLNFPEVSILFGGAVSENFCPTKEGLSPFYINKIEKDFPNLNYYHYSMVKSGCNFDEIYDPPTKVFYKQNQLIVLYNFYNRFFGNPDETAVSHKAVYGIVIKLPEKNKFHATTFIFPLETGVDLNQINAIINSIRFY